MVRISVLLVLFVFSEQCAISQSFEDSITSLNIEQLSKPRIKWLSLENINNMLSLDESMFGKRENSYHFIGLAFGGDTPQNFYLPPDTVKIILTSRTKYEEDEAYYELSHEVFHMISPAGKRCGNNLEEGLAVYSAKLYFDKYRPGNDFLTRSLAVLNSDYKHAYGSVTKLLQVDSNIIKKA